MIKLREGIVFNNPESRIREYCKIEVYWDYDDKHSVNDTITREDIDAANNLYAMIDHYDKGESKRVLAHSKKFAKRLSTIPNTPLHSIQDDKWENIKDVIKHLLRDMLSVYGIGLAKTTKILHLKRPDLFPVLDSFVVIFLTGKLLGSEKMKDIEIGLHTMDIARETINENQEAFEELQKNISDLPARAIYKFNRGGMEDAVTRGKSKFSRVYKERITEAHADIKKRWIELFFTGHSSCAGSVIDPWPVLARGCIKIFPVFCSSSGIAEIVIGVRRPRI